MEASEILLKILDYTGESRASLSKRIGLPPYRLQDIVRGKTAEILYEVADKLTKEFPFISKDWLLTGEGEMLISEGMTVTGNGNAVNTITGNGNKVSASVAGDFADLAGKFATSLQIAQNQLTFSQSQLAKSQEQMDRLIALLEKVTSSKNP